MLRKYSWIFVALLLATVLLSCQKKGIAPEVGNLAPSIRLSDIDGNTVALESLKGKVVIINFWAVT